METNRNWGRRSDLVAIMFPDIVSHESIFDKILSMRVLEELISLLGCKTYGIIEFEARESKNSLVA